jgi:hypothetical protein
LFDIVRMHRGVHSLGVRPAAGDTARRPHCMQEVG